MPAYGSWCVTRYDDVVKVLGDLESFSNVGVNLSRAAVV